MIFIDLRNGIERKRGNVEKRQEVIPGMRHWIAHVTVLSMRERDIGM